MNINDKLKGAYYRAPVTKLASRVEILRTFEELIEYFNTLNDMLNDSFKRVTSTRSYVIGLLQKMEATIAHFRFIKEQYKNEIDAHIDERLSYLMETFTASFTALVEFYDVNLYNHSDASDDWGSDHTKNQVNNFDEWEKSVGMAASDLGIRWYGGKLSDKFVATVLNNILHVIKVNTYDGKINEDVINSNPILELFIRTPKGISWLVLGENGGLGYNMIVKYQSPTLINDLKIASEAYHTPQEYDINHFDINLFIRTFLTESEIDNSNVYIKIKTNIPANSESGREGYYLSSTGEDKFDNYHESRVIVNASKKNLYEDNKDIAVNKRDNRTIEDLDNMDSPIKIKTQEKSSPIVKRNKVDNSIKSKLHHFYTELKNRFGNTKTSFKNETHNSNDDVMEDMMDTINGRVTHHDIILNLEDAFFGDDFNNLNKEYIDGRPVKYFKGQQVEDLFDYRNVGKVNLIAKNEHMFEVDGSVGGTNKVVHNDEIYEGNTGDKSVINRLYNNALFDSMSKGSYIENKFRVLNKVNENFKINCVLNTTQLGILLGTTKGIYAVKNNGGFMNPNVNVKCMIEYNNTIYIGTIGNGIYYWDENSQSFVPTNVIQGNINTFIIASKPNIDEKTLYAIKSDSSYVSKVDLGKYDLIGFAYCLIDKSDNGHGWINEHELDKNYNEDMGKCYRLDTIEIAQNLISSNEDKTQDYKIIFCEVLNKWYILNRNSKFLASTPKSRFENFSESEIAIRFGRNSVIDITYIDNMLYFAVEYTSAETAEERSEVWKYDGKEYSKVKYNNISVRNDRNYIDKSIYLSNLKNFA